MSKCVCRKICQLSVFCVKLQQQKVPFFSWFFSLCLYIYIDVNVTWWAKLFMILHDIMDKHTEPNFLLYNKSEENVVRCCLIEWWRERKAWNERWGQTPIYSILGVKQWMLRGREWDKNEITFSFWSHDEEKIQSKFSTLYLISRYNIIDKKLKINFGY